MSKRNNKGFTLVELIIAMSILSIVLGIGYSIFLKTGEASKYQGEVFSEQQTATIVNKYLTKDLEQCRTIRKVEGSEGAITYSYIINENIKNVTPIEYIVTRDTENDTYNVTRKDGSTSINIVSNQSTNSDKPFTINYKPEFKNILVVKLNGKNKKHEFTKYEFEVTSRITDNIMVSGWSGTDNEESNPNPDDGGETPNPNPNPDDGGVIPNPNPNPDDEGVIPNPNPNPDDGGVIPNPEEEALISGYVCFDYSRRNDNFYDLTLVANALEEKTSVNKTINDDNNYYEKKEKLSANIKNPNYNNLKIELNIPIANNDKLEAYLGSGSNKIIGNDLSNKKWKLFKEGLLTEEIEIYISEGIKVNSLQINNEEQTKKDKERYVYKVTNLSDKTINIKIDVDILIKKYKNNNKWVDPINTGQISVSFGKINNTD